MGFTSYLYIMILSSSMVMLHDYIYILYSPFTYRWAFSLSHNNASCFFIVWNTVSPHYSLTLNSLFTTAVSYPIIPLFTYPLSVSFIHWIINHLAFVNMTHRAHNGAAYFSTPTALLLLCKPVVHWCFPSSFI